MSDREEVEKVACEIARLKVEQQEIEARLKENELQLAKLKENKVQLEKLHMTLQDLVRDDPADPPTQESEPPTRRISWGAGKRVMVALLRGSSDRKTLKSVAYGDDGDSKSQGKRLSTLLWSMVNDGLVVKDDQGVPRLTEKGVERAGRVGEQSPL